LQLIEISEAKNKLSKRKGTAGSAVPFHFYEGDQNLDHPSQCFCIVCCSNVFHGNDFSIALFDEFRTLDINDGRLLDMAACIDL
jgi:SAM-dependent methyltransferase